jgi:hypothetical protein
MSDILLFVPDVPEFTAIVTAARGMDHCVVCGPKEGYHIVRSAKPLSFSRQALGMKPAVWYGIPTGGLVGTIRQFDRDVLVIETAQ